jgi:hypothetical protein
LTCDKSCLRRLAKSASRRLSADDPDEVPKHINALSTGIHELHECRRARAVAAFAIFTYKIEVCTPATKQ